MTTMTKKDYARLKELETLHPGKKMITIWGETQEWFLFVMAAGNNAFDTEGVKDADSIEYDVAYLQTLEMFADQIED